MATRIIIDIHERELRLFPRSDLIDANGRSLILPETRQLNALELRDIADGVQLRATGLVGYLPLTSHITLNIRPKFPILSLWYMLSEADEEFERILPIARQYQTSSDQVPHHLLARAFCNYLKDIMTAGLYKAYPIKRSEGLFRPKLAVGPTLARRISRGDTLRTVSDVFEFSKDLRANQILKSACLSFSNLIPRNSQWNSERRIIDDAVASLASIPRAHIQPSDLSLADKVPMRLREAYRGAFSVYSMLTGLTGIGFSYDSTGSQLPSFLFKLDDVFEAFIRNTMRQNFRDFGISIVDGNKAKNQGALFDDNKRYPTKPDMIFRLDRKPVMIGEVKYKPKLQESDRYQLISHTISSKCKIGVWFSPAQDGNASEVTYVGMVGGSAKFYHCTLSLSSDLEVEMKMVSEMINDLLLKPLEEAA